MAGESGFAALADGEVRPVESSAPAVRWRVAATPTIEDDPEARFSRQFAAEWLALLFGLIVVGLVMAGSLLRAYESRDAMERDRLRVQARVVEANVGQQIEGMSRALATVRDDYRATPVGIVPTTLSQRMKALSDSIPGVRSMALLATTVPSASSSAIERTPGIASLSAFMRCESVVGTMPAGVAR